MQNINASHIVLVPKKDNPKRIGDFKPISLLNSSVKILTKLLAKWTAESYLEDYSHKPVWVSEGKKYA
jgi:hypothetical protein